MGKKTRDPQRLIPETHKMLKTTEVGATVLFDVDRGRSREFITLTVEGRGYFNGRAGPDPRRPRSTTGSTRTGYGAPAAPNGLIPIPSYAQALPSFCPRSYTFI